MSAGPARATSVAAPLVGAPVVPAAPTPADKPAMAGGAPAANRFAELLRRQRGQAPAPAAPAPTPPAHADADAGADGGEAGDTSSIEAKAAPANAAKARTATPKATTGKASGEDPEQGSDDGDAACGDNDSVDGDDGDRIDRAASTTAPADRLDVRLVAALAIDALRRLAPTRPAESDGATESAAADRDISAALGTAARSGAGHARDLATMDAASDRRASSLEGSADTALRVAADARFQLARGGDPLPAMDPQAATPAHDRSLDAPSAPLGVGAAPHRADAAAAASPATTLALATPVDAPDFAAALGVRVSLLAQDGVQQAELHLNPAETGPVSIHISLDGTAARVDFGADLASTRAAIERGLPELASALRDAGFTLAGGGVSQHAGGRASDDEARRSTVRLDGAGQLASPAIALDSRRVVRAVAAGGIDLYA